PFVLAGAGVIVLPGPLHATVGASYVNYLGLYSGLIASLGLSYDFAPSATPVKTQQLPPAKVQPLNVQPSQSTGPLELRQLSFDDVYPVFRSYYDSHPL